MGVGREAARRELHGRRPPPGVSRQALSRAGRDLGALVPPGDAEARRDDRAGGVEHVRGRRRARARRADAGDAPPGQTASEDRPEGAPEGQRTRVREAHRNRRRNGTDPPRPSTHRADRGPPHGRRGGPGRRLDPGSDQELSLDAPEPPPPAVRPLRVRAPRAQGRRRRERRDARLGRAVHRPRHERAALPAVQGGAAVGARAVRGEERFQQHGPPGRRRAAR